ncbi:hypothetical protein V8F33_006597 [Rhypophila sp. PSN 637]
MAAAVDPPEAVPLPSHLVEHEKDPNGNQRGYIKGTDYSLPYSSPWSRNHDQEIKNMLLRHMNCGYLSTTGTPPTLLALKQHAQSLCVLIQALNPTLKSGEILISDPTRPENRAPLDSTSALHTGKKPSKFQDPRDIKYKLNDAFDFLSDLSVPYTNDDPNHHKPLHGLLNEIRGVHEAFGSDSHCPLMIVKPRGSDEGVRMYANHHNLVMHANACLERLDHDFSPVGGLLGLLPVQTEDPEGEDLAKARNSLFGQWLLFTQQLVGRMHELERSYGNALDALAGEAAVPYQYLSSLGTDARQSGREIAFPQDRWLLVNAGEQVFSTIHTLLDRQEEIHQTKAALYRRNVVSPQDGKEYATGLIPITIPTRYYRLAGQGKGTIFIVPAYQTHPSVEYTRLLEDQPTIISSFQPTWPRRASELEKDYRDKVEISKVLTSENAKLKENLAKIIREREATSKSLHTTLQVQNLLRRSVQGLPRPTEGSNELEKIRKDPDAPSDQELRYAQALEDQRKRADLAEMVLSTTALAVLAANGASASSSGDKLPYIPTTILVSTSWPLDDSSSAPKKPSIHDNIAYILTPKPDSSGDIDLLTVDFSSTLSTSGDSSMPQPVPVPSNSGDNMPPFLTGVGSAKDITFTPTILPNGTLAIISGGSSCSSSTNSAQIYTYSSTISSSASSPHPSGVWTVQSVTAAAPTSWDAAQSLNPYFYSSGISFSSQLAPTVSEPVFYLYGGMCPYSSSNPANASSSESDDGNWQTSAAYSNKMLRISPDTNSGYTLENAPSPGGPPVAVAGYTFTPLTPPSLATRTGGIVTQQMSYVMLGGHTQSAFVNMSTAAVWSLPEETWSFVAIKDSEPADNTKVDLAIKDVHGVRITVPATRKVDSRSGHSAVLSEDGSRLVVLGGWVGDLHVPAQPQLVILEVGGHGGGVGFEEWRWGVPPLTTGGNENGGIYGHGAVLLPGDIPSPGSKKMKKKRQASSQGWQDEYTHPSASSSSPNSPDGDSKSTDSSSSSSKFLGLGVGLGVGIPVLLALLLAARDDALRDLAQGVPIRHNSDEMSEHNDPNAGIGFFPWNASTAQEWYTGGLDPYSAPTNNRRRSLGYETLRAGQGKNGLYQPPPPMPPAPLMTSNLFGSVARGLYQPTTGVEYSSSGGGAHGVRSPGNDEDDDLEDGDLAAGRKHHPLISPELDDMDKGSLNLGQAGTSPSPELVIQQKQGQAQDAEVQGWVSDVDAADAVLSARISRHGSTTTRPPALKLSGLGSGTTGQGQTTPTRLSPTRRHSNHGTSGRLTPGTAQANDKQLDDGRTGSNLSDASAFSFVQGAERAHMRSSNPNHNPNKQVNRSESLSGGSTSSTKTYSTAKSTFANLQAEGPSLLLTGGRHSLLPHPLEQQLYLNPDDIVDVEGADEEYDPVPGSPSKNRRRRSQRHSWFGSLRRVFSGATPSPGGSASSRGESPTREGLLGPLAVSSMEGSGGGGDSSSNGRWLQGMGLGLGPGGLLVRRKQGRDAWEDILPSPKATSSSSSPVKEKHMQQEDDPDWDVEKAVEQRLVQVMFTVPKERLRVVNADLDGDDMSRHEEPHVGQVAVLVDPEGESYQPSGSSTDSSSSSSIGGGASSVDLKEEGGEKEHVYDDEKGKEKESVTSKTLGISAPVPVPLPVPAPSTPSKHHQERSNSETSLRLVASQGQNTDLLTVHGHGESTIDNSQQQRKGSSSSSHQGEGGSGISPSPSTRSANGADLTTIHTAEMVRLERPRTRVLEMVESIESKSRDASPSGSPVRL